MITTKTGAKKLEANDNWAKIVPNAQGQDSAHNDSVEAHDSAIESLCQTISGTTNNCGHTINSGEYFIANGGKYKATASIPVNGAWSGSAQAVSDNDLINALNNSLRPLLYNDISGTAITLTTSNYTTLSDGYFVITIYAAIARYVDGYVNDVKMLSICGSNFVGYPSIALFVRKGMNIRVSEVVMNESGALFYPLHN